MRRIRRILTDLDVARSPRNMDAPEYRLHPLKGDRCGRWSVRVGGNWRIVFRFEDFEAVGVDLIAGRSAPPCGFRSPLSGKRPLATLAAISTSSFGIR